MIKTNRVLFLTTKWTVSVCSLSPQCICWQMIIQAMKMCHLLFIGWQPNNLCTFFLSSGLLLCPFLCSLIKTPRSPHLTSTLLTLTKLSGSYCFITWREHQLFLQSALKLIKVGAQEAYGEREGDRENEVEWVMLGGGRLTSAGRESTVSQPLILNVTDMR